MVAKKSPKANLENKKTISLLLGFVVVLSFIYISFEWSTKDVKSYEKISVIDTPEDVIDVIQTPPGTPPPPPPPLPKPIIVERINVVKDTEEVKSISDSLFIQDFEKPIDIPVYFEPKEDDSDIIIDFIKVEKMPVFKDDLVKFLGRNLKYPRMAEEAEIQGRVICQFIVNKDGSVSDIEILKGVDPLLDKEAMRVIGMMPNWEPGIQHGKPVRVRYQLPVTFRLN